MDKKVNTNDGKKGGTLEGPSHDDGGIKVIITDDNRPVEVEGGEVIINKHAAKKHWKTLSKINQSAGNGVPIHEPKFRKGGNAQQVEEPTEEEIEARWDKKKNSIQELANNIQSLRNNVTRDLSSEDEKTALTALVIAIMDSTAERVGNEDSADNGHFGVTGFQKRHIKVEGNKITLKYVGKSGVEHDTTFTDEKIANALKKAIANTPSKFVFRTSDDFQIKADKVNRYLSDFNVTAKDLRGYSANKWIIEKLKEVNPEQEETKRKTQFNKILSSVAEKIGHGKATLKKHYLVPELSETFISEGKIIDIKKLGGDLYKKGRTIAQTPAPKKDRVFGSKVNKEGSSESIKSAKSITFDDKTIEAIENKVKEHNEKHPDKKINVASAKAVVRRGMGAYSKSHRPTITDSKPNSRVAWGLARLNAFIYKIVNGKSKSGKYIQDDDLIQELGYEVKKYGYGTLIKDAMDMPKNPSFKERLDFVKKHPEIVLKTGGELENHSKKLTKEEFIEWLKSRTNKAFVDYRVWDIYERGNNRYFGSKGENYGYDYSGKINRINALNLKDSEKVGHFEFSEEQKVGLIIKSDNGKWFYLIGKHGNDFYAIIDGDSRLYVVKDMAQRWGYKLLSAKQYNDYYNVPERYRMYEHRTKLKTGGEIESERKVFYSIWNNYVGRIELGYSNIETENGINNGVFLSLSDALKGLFDFIKGGLEYGNYSLAKDYPKSKFTIEQVDTSKKPSKGQEFYSKVVYTITAKEVLDLYEINRLKKGGELEKGIKVEREHIATARKLFNNEITPEQAAESIAREHIKEDPKYYTKLSTIEKHGRGATITKKFKGLDKALEDFEDLDVLSYIPDPSIYGVFLFFCRFKRKYKNINERYGIFIYSEYRRDFVEEPASLDLYGLTLSELDKKYPALRVSKVSKEKFAQGSNINTNLEYKIGDTIRFNYGRADERVVLVGVVSDYLTNDRGYVVSSGFSQIAVDEKDIIGLEEVKEKKKRFLFFEQGGVADFDIADYYEITFAGGGAIEKAKTIITQKIGLSEDSANYLTSMSPKLAVWLADSILKYEIDDLTKRINEADKNLSDKYKTSKEEIKERAFDNINNRSNYIRVNFGSDIRSIIDWISHPLTPNQNLKQLSFQEALDKAHIFHEELKVLGGDIDYEEPKENAIIKEYPEEDGVKYYWVYIPSNFCNIESSRMGHCGRTGYGNTLISLRSIKPYGKGHTISDSHVTIAYNPNEGLFYQVKGKKNQKPAEKYRFYIFDLIQMMAKEEITFPIPSEYTGQIDETPLEFNGFGSEYDSKEDYDFQDMSESEIKLLYEIKPEIFNNFEGKILLYDIGLSTERPVTSFILYKPAKTVEDLLAYNSYRNYSKDFIYHVISGQDYDLDGNWSYYYDEGWLYGVDDLNSENEERVIQEIMRITNHSKEQVTTNGIKYYLNGDDEEFDSDYFDNIKRSIASAMSNAERDDYQNYYYGQVKDALSELGVVKKLNDEGLEIGIDLTNFLDYKQIGSYMRVLESQDLEDVFFEAESNGDIQLPELNIDDRYTASADYETFNQIFAGGDLQEGYKTGGSVTPAQKRKVAKVMHEWKAGRLHSGSKKGPIVKDQKQAVAIALSQAGLSNKAEYGVTIRKKSRPMTDEAIYHELLNKRDDLKRIATDVKSRVPENTDVEKRIALSENLNNEADELVTENKKYLTNVSEQYAKGKNIKEKLAKNEAEWYSFIREDLRKWNAEHHEDDRMSLNDYIGEVGAIYGFKPVLDRRTFERSLVRLANNPLPLKNFSRMTESNLFNEYYKQTYLNDDYDEANYNALMNEVRKRNLQDKFDQKALEKGYYKTGGNFDKETYNKWKSLVNMTYNQIKKFYESKEGREAGLSNEQADNLGIKSGRESARWIMKMKQTNVSDWTPKMWEWAKRQISFISRMSGNKGPLYDDKGSKTRKHTSLLIWGHNPEK